MRKRFLVMRTWAKKRWLDGRLMSLSATADWTCSFSANAWTMTLDGLCGELAVILADVVVLVALGVCQRGTMNSRCLPGDESGY